MKRILTYLIILIGLGFIGYQTNNSIPVFQEKIDELLSKFSLNDETNINNENLVNAELLEDEKLNIREYSGKKNEIIINEQHISGDKIVFNKYANNLVPLVNKLTKTARNDREKVEKLFRWVAKNIKYDDYAYNYGKYGDNSALGVYKSRKAVCEGFSNLLKTLCDIADIEARTIHGYSKGYSYQPGQKFTRTTHAWNAIKIDNQWKLFDVTWAEGNGKMVKGKLVSSKHFNNYWFDVPPKQFIFTHLPKDPVWQLIPKQISLSQFEDLPNIGGSFFKSGFNSDIVFKKAISGKVKMFPETYAIEYPLSAILVPYTRNLSTGKTYNFQIESNNIKEVIAINNDKHTSFNKSGDTFKLKYIAKKGELKISAKFYNSNYNFLTILKYNVN